MAKISVPNGLAWSDELAAILVAAGHVVSQDGAHLAFVDASAPLDRDDMLTIVVAGVDQLHHAVEHAKGGAYAFVRYPFISEEVALLVERAVDHQALAQENHELRRRVTDEPSAAVANGADPVAAARKLAGKPLADIEKQVILSTLEQFHGHRVRTATALGIGVRTLGMKIKRWREEGEPIVSRSTAQRPVTAGA